MKWPFKNKCKMYVQCIFKAVRDKDCFNKGQGRVTKQFNGERTFSLTYSAGTTGYPKAKE